MLPFKIAKTSPNLFLFLPVVRHLAQLGVRSCLPGSHYRSCRYFLSGLFTMPFRRLIATTRRLQHRVRRATEKRTTTDRPLACPSAQVPPSLNTLAQVVRPARLPQNVRANPIPRSPAPTSASFHMDSPLRSCRAGPAVPRLDRTLASVKGLRFGGGPPPAGPPGGAVPKACPHPEAE